MDREFQSLAEILKVPEDMMVERVEKLLDELKEKEREIARLRERLAVGGVDSLVAGRIMVDDIPVVAAPCRTGRSGSSAQSGRRCARQARFRHCTVGI